LEIAMTAQPNTQARTSKNDTVPSNGGFFDLHVSMVGYMSRIRWVNPKNKRQGGRKSEPFLACVISALHGDKNEPNYTYFDLRVSGDEAINLVSELEAASDEGRKITVSAKVGDIYPHIYERDAKDENGRKTGDREMAALIKGRLLLLNSVKIDGEVWYTRPTDKQDAPAAEASEAEAEGQPAGGGDVGDSSFGGEHAEDGHGQDDAPQERRQGQGNQQARRTAPSQGGNGGGFNRRPQGNSRQGGYRASGYASA